MEDLKNGSICVLHDLFIRRLYDQMRTDNLQIMEKNRMFYLINKNTKEIADVVTLTLEDAQKVASKYLGGEPIEWVERF